MAGQPFSVNYASFPLSHPQPQKLLEPGSFGEEAAEVVLCADEQLVSASVKAAVTGGDDRRLGALLCYFLVTASISAVGAPRPCSTRPLGACSSA